MNNNVIKRTFTREFLVEELGLPWSVYGNGRLIEDKVIGNTRWAIKHRLVFQYEDKYYQTYYYIGATECQDIPPWEGEDKVECIEVEEQEVTVLQWVPVTVPMI